MDREQLSEIIRDAVHESVAHEGKILDRDELRDLMHEAVIDALSTIGIDANSPLEVQKDMQFMRELRLTSGRIKQKSILTVVGFLLAAGGGMIWLGFKQFMS